jgi:small subunit ribosomal protein S21
VTKIKVRSGESLEQALRRFSRAVKIDGTVEEVRSRMEYTKPSTIKFRNKKAVKRRIYFENKNNK